MMKTKISIILNLILATMLVMLSGCVGTVKETNPISTKVFNSADGVLKSYEGIVTANAISDKKVEVTFKQVSGNPDEYSYSITYDGQIIPILIDANNIRTEPDTDNLKYTIDNGLNPNTTYSFTVQIKNKKSGAMSSNSAKKQTTTFNNVTADFYGVGELRNVSGAAGTTSIQVFWPEAIKTGPPSGLTNPGDPISYRVTVVNANNLGVVDINDESKVAPNRVVYSVNSDLRSTTINGLTPNTKYYVQVRSVHSQSKDAPYSTDPTYKLEANTRYLAISTYTDDLGAISTNLNSVVLTHAPGYGGYFAINAAWEAPEGNFDHIRVFYAKKSEHEAASIRNFINANDHDVICDGAESIETEIYCQKVSSSFQQSTLTNLAQNSDYVVMAAICQDFSCRYNIVFEGKELRTTPQALGFDGIKTIQVANSLSQLDKLILNYNAIDTTKGHIDGLEVYYTNDPLDTNPKKLPSADFPSIYVENYDYLTDTQINIGGLDLNGSLTHCFDVYPYTINAANATVEERSGFNRQCIYNASISAPTAVEFEGVKMDDSICNNVNKTIELKWDLPSDGVFSRFEIYYKKVTSTGETFNFDNAIAGAANYYKVNVGSSSTSRTIGVLPTGQYKVGILTYYYSTTLGLPMRSGYNGNIKYCNL